jgi:alpha-L-fucosidase
MRFIIILFLLPVLTVAQPVPSQPQLKWHDMEYYLFMHFGPNTFTNKEWGHGDEPEDVFNPTDLDCKQWCRTAKKAGAKGIIITAKHHDGFCLWPSAYSTHTVRESKWRNGKGDVLKELSAACKEYGLKFGVYLSPWDRNHPDYGTEKYNDVFVNMLKEVFSNYGPIWELWWDGANGEGPNGKKQIYNWQQFKETVKQVSPETVVFSDVGPHIRWVGNENGFAGTTNWNMLDTTGYTPGAGAPATNILNRGNINGEAWIPGECDVSIRPGWFYHENENDKVKTPRQLFEIYLKSVGRGANLLLNVPPDNRGLIRSEDVASLVAFKKLRDRIYSGNLLKSFSRSTSENNLPSINCLLKKRGKVNMIVLQEEISRGQSIAAFSCLLYNGNKLQKTIEGTTIGNKRIIYFPAVMATRVELIITSTRLPLVPVKNMQAYYLKDYIVPQ